LKSIKTYDSYDLPKHYIGYTVVIEIIQLPLQIRFIGNIYRL